MSYSDTIRGAFEPFGKEYDTHTPSDPRDAEIERLTRERNETIASLTRERDDARAKADHYARNWYEAKSEFGTAMAKMRERTHVLEREHDEARALLREALSLRTRALWIAWRERTRAALEKRTEEGRS